MARRARRDRGGGRRAQPQRRVHLRGAVATGVLLFVVATAGALRVAEGSLARSGEVLRVGLVQGNIEQAEKWDPSLSRADHRAATSI